MTATLHMTTTVVQATSSDSPKGLSTGIACRQSCGSPAVAQITGFLCTRLNDKIKDSQQTSTPADFTTKSKTPNKLLPQLSLRQNQTATLYYHKKL
ncbi:hypothetical protein JYU34_020692 [Plutella xylostella]|uniref:Uncharacterized protein n=1 Tax=Plutella xylostella TaxID=51655 RepID=A0ABQ7PUV5_PLUXY|nr:hypothetical protein JYU34_020692 [Plutella xylostella]